LPVAELDRIDSRCHEPLLLSAVAATLDDPPPSVKKARCDAGVTLPRHRDANGVQASRCAKGVSHRLSVTSPSQRLPAAFAVVILVALATGGAWVTSAPAAYQAATPVKHTIPVTPAGPGITAAPLRLDP
jgi:hypothetical protein